MNATRGADSSWPAGPRTPGLTPDQVDVWRVDLAVDADQLQRDRALLGAEESDLAERYRFDLHRHRFIARRAALRRILGRYLGGASTDLRFATNAHGKPHLAGVADLTFSTSHSTSVGLVAVGRRRALGVDVESLDRDVERERLARRFFAPAEAETITRLAGEAAVTAFFACWTRKEAYVKARGAGLAMGLDTFEVSIDPLEPATLCRTDDDPRNRDRWSMRHLAPGSGYLGALAAEGNDLALRQWHLADG